MLRRAYTRKVSFCSQQGITTCLPFSFFQRATRVFRVNFFFLGREIQPPRHHIQPITAFPLVLLPRAKRIHLCVTCRACLDVRSNVYMTRNVGLQMEPAAISLKHEYSNSLAVGIRLGNAINWISQFADPVNSEIGPFGKRKKERERSKGYTRYRLDEIVFSNRVITES